MKKRLAIVIFLLLQLAVYAQNSDVGDSLKANISHRKLNGFLSMITDFTINEHQQFASTGIGGAFLFFDKFYVGGYALGLISPLYQRDIFNNTSNDLQLNFAHGGLWLGVIESPYKKIHSTFSLKIGWGALFLHNNNSATDIDLGRTEFLVIMPEIETEIMITNWLQASFGIGVRFLSGVSAQYKDTNANLINIYNPSDFEGLIASFTLSFGNFSLKNVR